jgi:ABC-type Zn2+ transport system substrate-binding protein/surface adhesin
MSHLRAPDGTVLCGDHAAHHQEPHDHDGHEHDHDHDDEHEHEHHGHGEHGHSHGLVDRSILRSREGLKAVGLSLGVLGVAAVAQLLIFVLTNSIALLADLIHNFATR